MRTWQKIIGITFFTIFLLAILLCNWGVYSDIHAWTVTFAAHDCKDVLYILLNTYNLCIGLLYIIALALFISLWRKGGKR